MRPAALAAGILVVLLSPAPVAAGELWSDFDDDRINICPAQGEFPTEQVSEYVAYNVYELAKSVDAHFEDTEAQADGRASAPTDDTVSDFTSDEQASLRSMVESAEFFSRNILPPMQRVVQVDGRAHDLQNVTIAPPTGKGTKERLKIGLAAYLIASGQENADLVYDYLDALRGLNDWLATEELIDREPLRSIRLRLALDAFREAYRNLRPALFEAIEAPDYSARLETQIRQACSEKPKT